MANRRQPLELERAGDAAEFIRLPVLAQRTHCGVEVGGQLRHVDEPRRALHRRAGSANATQRRIAAINVPPPVRGLGQFLARLHNRVFDEVAL
jgi:hypothetical protein